MHTRADEIADALDLPRSLMTEELLTALAEDPTFLHHLRVCSGDPRMLDILLREVAHGTRAESAAVRHDTGIPSDRELVARASRALARWAVSGFSRVTDEDYRDRLSRCSACEHLVRPPSRVLYQVVSRPQQDARTICGLCGCDVRRKARLATEHCPDGRWRELIDSRSTGDGR